MRGRFKREGGGACAIENCRGLNEGVKVKRVTMFMALIGGKTGRAHKSQSTTCLHPEELCNRQDRKSRSTDGKSRAELKERKRNEEMQ